LPGTEFVFCRCFDARSEEAIAYAYLVCGVSVVGQVNCDA